MSVRVLDPNFTFFKILVCLNLKHMIIFLTYRYSIVSLPFLHFLFQFLINLPNCGKHVADILGVGGAISSQFSLDLLCLGYKRALC